MNIFSKLYLILWISLITVEMVAATTSYVPMDTMSEHFWKFQNDYPTIARIAMTVGLFVLWAHLVLKPGTVK